MNSINPTDLFGYLIQDVARLMSRMFEKQPGDLKITRTQARLLAYVALNEGANQSEFATLMDVQKITLTKLVDELETRRLVDRRVDKEDRRVRRLYMATGARPVLDAIWQRLSKVSDIGLTALPEHRRENFLKDMIAVRNHLVKTLASEDKIAERLS